MKGLRKVMEDWIPYKKYRSYGKCIICERYTSISQKRICVECWINMDDFKRFLILRKK
jgi:hypothetical protein